MNMSDQNPTFPNIQVHIHVVCNYKYAVQSTSKCECICYTCTALGCMPQIMALVALVNR